jgi:hypothetical protein
MNTKTYADYTAVWGIRQAKAGEVVKIKTRLSGL